MSVTVVVGGQWGDEGKGKIVDTLSESADVVARFQGGANAGHTVYIDDNKFILHQMPSGILRDNIQCILGNGMVIDPVELNRELEVLSEAGIQLESRIHVSSRIHLVTPLHKAIDRVSEEELGEEKIGTTGRGIGPAYISKISRKSLRMEDICNPEYATDFLRKELVRAVTRGLVPQEAADEIENQNREFCDACSKISPLITDTVYLIHDWMDAGRDILVEGAQGILLDVDHGTYPFVTSSNTSLGGVGTGLGIPAKKIDRVIGIFKAYTTRVGSGPFPTEQFGDTGKYLHIEGNEYGATTGRPRRCGWFDAVLSHYSCMINGYDEIALTKLDVLNELDEIRICVSYKGTKQLPGDLSGAEPEYITVPGWKQSLENCSTYSELPEQARDYVEIIESLLKTRISIISTGVKRNQSIRKN